MQIVLNRSKIIRKNSKLILKTQERFEKERHNVFTEKINNIALSSNYDKTIQSIDSIETYTYGANKDLICKEEKIKRNNIMKQYKNILKIKTFIILQKKT